MDFITGEGLFFPSVRRLKLLYAYRPNALVDEIDNITIPNHRDTPTGINDFYVVHAHAHEGALRNTTKQMGVTLVGQMHELKDCSLANGIRISNQSKTINREVKRHFRVFVDLGGKKHVKSIGGKKYPMIIRDDFSRYTWMYIICHKFEAADTLANFMSDFRVEGIPSRVVVVR